MTAYWVVAEGLARWYTAYAAGVQAPLPTCYAAAPGADDPNAAGVVCDGMALVFCRGVPGGTVFRRHLADGYRAVIDGGIRDATGRARFVGEGGV